MLKLYTIDLIITTLQLFIVIIILYVNYKLLKCYIKNNRSTVIDNTSVVLVDNNGSILFIRNKNTITLPGVACKKGSHYLHINNKTTNLNIITDDIVVCHSSMYLTYCMILSSQMLTDISNKYDTLLISPSDITNYNIDKECHDELYSLLDFMSYSQTSFDDILY